MTTDKVLINQLEKFIKEDITTDCHVLTEPLKADNNAPYGTDVFYTLNVDDPDYIPFGYSYRNNISWMSFIDDAVKLYDLVIPGSHNCGTYSMRSSFVGDLYARTQAYNIMSQLMYGIRYLDLRCKLKDGEVVIHHGGVTGRVLRGIFTSQIMPFVRNVPEELIILDFQELEDNCAQDVINILQSISGFSELCVPSSMLNNSLTMGTIRANGYRFVVLFSEYVSQNWICWRSTKLWSPYDESIYKGSTSNIPPYVDERCLEWENQRRNTLFVAQLISTTTISPPTTIENRDGWILNNWVKSQTKDSSVNIIMRDFVDRYPDVIAYIIGLNLEKDYVKASAKARFKIVSQVQNYAIKENNYVYTIGESGFAGSTTIYSERIQREGQLFGSREFTKELTLEKGMAITHISITDHWKDGTNGSYTIEEGGRFLDNHVKVKLKSAVFRGLDWTLTIRAAPVAPAYFYAESE